MMICNEEMKVFLAQVAGSNGKGPISLTHNIADRNIQIHAAKAYPAEYVDKSARQEAREENNNPYVCTRQ